MLGKYGSRNSVVKFFCKLLYIKIRSILEIDPKTIHEELWESVLHYLQQLQDEQNVFVMSMIILDLLAHYPNLQMKIFNCFDKLSAMIHIQNYS